MDFAFERVAAKLGCLTLLCCSLIWAVPTLFADDDDGGFLGLNKLDLGIANKSGSFAMNFSGILDVEYYAIGDRGPGMIYSDHSFANERLSLFVDTTLGEHWLGFFQTRVDRGFDPDDHPVQVRPDEYFLRYTLPGTDWSASVQVGKFATPLGNFVPRHDSFHNPLVRAPLPYDHFTSIGDDGTPGSNDEAISGRDIEDMKHTWVPILWGPVYHTGGMVFGTLGDFDLRFAVTNAAPSERPEEWNWQKGDSGNLAYSARVGWRAFPGFVVGLDWSRGPYLRREAEPNLDPGSNRAHFDQKLVGVDLEYKVGHLELFSEIYATEWEATHIEGNLDSLCYYVEARYKLTPRLHVAARWGQILFNKLEQEDGISTKWERDSWRAELGFGYRFEENLLAKIEYEVNEQQGGLEPNDNMASFSMSVSF